MLCLDLLNDAQLVLQVFAEFVTRKTRVIDQILGLEGEYLLSIPPQLRGGFLEDLRSVASIYEQIQSWISKARDHDTLFRKSCEQLTMNTKSLWSLSLKEQLNTYSAVEKAQKLRKSRGWRWINVTSGLLKETRRLMASSKRQYPVLKQHAKNLMRYGSQVASDLEGYPKNEDLFLERVVDGIMVIVKGSDQVEAFWAKMTKSLEEIRKKVNGGRSKVKQGENDKSMSNANMGGDNDKDNGDEDNDGCGPNAIANAKESLPFPRNLAISMRAKEGSRGRRTEKRERENS